MRHILKRPDGSYTLNEKEGKRPIPPKYSPQDKYGSYRRKVKEPSYKERGLL